MMNKQTKSILTLFILLALIFGVPYLWRRHRDRDIKENSNYAFGRIEKKTGSLKNGYHWHYVFNFKNKLYSGHWPTHVDYKVHIGDYFLINFSGEAPKHNKILYAYKLKKYHPDIFRQVWDTIPLNLVESGRK